MKNMSPKMMKAYAKYEKKESPAMKKKEAMAGMKMKKKAVVKKMGKKK